jgi:hypothetical protein
MVMTLALVNTRSAVPCKAPVDVVVASAPVVEELGGGCVVVEVVLVPSPSEPEVQDAVTSTRVAATRTSGPSPK